MEKSNHTGNHKSAKARKRSKKNKSNGSSKLIVKSNTMSDKEGILPSSSKYTTAKSNYQSAVGLFV